MLGTVGDMITARLKDTRSLESDVPGRPKLKFHGEGQQQIYEDSRLAPMGFNMDLLWRRWKLRNHKSRSSKMGNTMSATLLLDGQEFYYITYILQSSILYSPWIQIMKKKAISFFAFLPTTTFLESSDGILSTLRNNWWKFEYSTQHFCTKFKYCPNETQIKF